MLHRFHDRFGTAGVVIGVIALIVALGGSAFAASGGLTGKQKKEVKAIAKSFAGKEGPAGKDGVAGTNGTNGKDGAPGQQGEPGTDGTDGAPGKNVLTTAITNAGLEGHCFETGGTRFQVEGSATKEYVCNGKEGASGSASATLPPGQTEAGSWGVSGMYPTSNNVIAPISFPIPLSEADVELIGEEEAGFPPTYPQLHIIKPGDPQTTECPGTVNEPQASAGNLCVYASQLFGIRELFGTLLINVRKPDTTTIGVTSGGALVVGSSSAGEGEVRVEVVGSWAVTAEEE
jgi:hypothetical protein